MTATTSNMQLPYLENTRLDGKKLYTPKEWTERLYQTDLQYRYTTGIIRGNNTDQPQLDTKRTRNKTRPYLGSWSVSN